MKTLVCIATVTRRYCVGAILMGLAGCSPVVEPPKQPSFRDPSANIGATTRFDPKRFAGDWHVVARFVETGETPARDAVTVTYDRAKAQVVMQVGQDQQTFDYSGSAVLKPKNGEPLVVMWVDEGFRTAVLGAASGQAGFIMDRKPRPSPDRFKAATQILNFYGWDISRLQRTK